MTVALEPRVDTARWYGVYPAIVADVRDPDGIGRVKVRLPWAPDASVYEAWARVATLMAGQNRGTWFVPDPDDEVLVAFEGGDARRPFVVGVLWNGADHPPERMDSGGRNTKKVIRSRNGVKVTLDDETGRERLVVETPGGQRMTLSDGPGAVEIVDANGNAITLGVSGVTIRSSGTVTVQASQVKVSAGMVNVDAGISKFSGVVKADTVITNAVISSSYTPGAGNIW